MPSNLLSADSDFPTFTGKETPVQQIQMIHNYLYRFKEQLQYTLNNLSVENWNGPALESLTDGAKLELSEKLSLAMSQLSELKNKIDVVSGGIADARGVISRVSDLEEIDSGPRLDALDGEAGRVKALEDRVSGLDGPNGRVSALEAVESGSRLDALDGEAGKIPSMESRLEALDGEAGRVNVLVGRINELDGPDGRVSALEAVESGSRLDALDGEGGKISEVEARLGALDGQDGSEQNLCKRVEILENSLQGVPDRVGTLEKALEVDEAGSVRIGAEGKRLELIGEIYINGMLLTMQGGGSDEIA